MAKLTSSQRKRLPKKDFALPHGRYPINDRNHAKAALSRVSQYGTVAEKTAVRKKVHSKYPSIGDSIRKKAKGKSSRKRVSSKA